MNEKVDAFMKSVNQNCLPRIDQATVPILGIQNDRLIHDRTGVLYSIAGEHFILTASHTLRRTVECNIDLVVSMNKPNVHPLPLAEARFHSTEESGRDVSAIWLPPDLAIEIAKHKSFLHHNQVSLSRIQNDAPTVFFGYPMDWSGHLVAENDVKSFGVAFVSTKYAGERDLFESYHDDVHLLLRYSPDTIRSIDKASQQLPHLKGISGCGIWQVGDGLNARNANNLTLVGIQHRWIERLGYVQGTFVGYAIQLIVANYPELGAAMNLVYPK